MVAVLVEESRSPCVTPLAESVWWQLSSPACVSQAKTRLLLFVHDDTYMYMYEYVVYLHAILFNLSDFKGQVWFVIVCSLVGKTCFAMAYAAVFLYTTELYPTNLRNVGLGTCQAAAKVASIIAPYFRVLVSAS